MKFVQSLVLWVLISYVIIVPLNTFLMGRTRWLSSIAPAVGCGIGLSLAQQSNFRLSF